MKKCILILVAVCAMISYSMGQAGNNTMLWRISTPGGGTPSYLFGTMHIAQKKLMLFTDSVYNAIAETDAFFGELDYEALLTVFSDTSTIGFFQQKADFLDSITHTPGWRAMVARMNRKYGTNVNADSLDQFMTFSSKISTDVYGAEPGLKAMDLMLSDYAKSLGKKIGGLETYLLQIDMLYNIIGIRVQDSTLSFDNEAAMITNFKRYYEHAQLDSINQYLQSIHPNYRNIIFTQRNKTMADSIAMHMEAGAAFFAIGCGHLPGSDGVIELLTQKGFSVTPVHSGNRMSLLLLNTLKDRWIKSSTPDAPKAISVEQGNALQKRLHETNVPGSKNAIEITDVKVTALPHTAPPLPPPLPPPPPPLKMKKRNTKKRNQ
jgi:uncharacterized protein YbaP (TraB family)